MAEEPTGFLGRWARRKTDVRQGKPLDEPAAPAKSAPGASLAVSPAALVADSAQVTAPATPPAEPSEKLLSLDDVKVLTQDSDFKPFMARNVGADVRNAAMKKLFTDPHYNVMDGLDIYISDYSIADPIPESMLRQMVGAKMLKIFDEPDEDEQRQAAATLPPEPLPSDALNKSTPEAVAPSGNSPDASLAEPQGTEPSSQPELSDSPGASQTDDHAHSHLRLQPDHAPSAPSAGHGT
ncbi:DUF3306 domain-containing protein [Polaromonas sp.]|uniref:DUF3306 domain-containing protein n=1 Tax=Polaromonas sp. TaxID=1869339 RepID=UPI0013B9B3D2|nr:DUF3306 domain-containing protein [Polaromonas sp.]NDP64350.1 DUF3306 domain-containing protein [Polaromonas sp.]